MYAWKTYRLEFCAVPPNACNNTRYVHGVRVSLGGAEDVATIHSGIRLVLRGMARICFGQLLAGFDQNVVWKKSRESRSSERK
jgi:hypothetical protein